MEVQRRKSFSASMRERCAEAVLELNNCLKDSDCGSLIQVWMPEYFESDNVVLATQGLPYSVIGIGDLLALFRCISCRYHFPTDVFAPKLLGAVGRVFTTSQPEMCSDLQRYEKPVYLRVDEAQRCCVHSTVLMPFFESKSRDRPVGVIEVVKNAKNVCFSELVDQMSQALGRVRLHGIEMSPSALELGLRSWPLKVDASFDHLKMDRIVSKSRAINTINTIETVDTMAGELEGPCANNTEDMCAESNNESDSKDDDPVGEAGSRHQVIGAARGYQDYTLPTDVGASSLGMLTTQVDAMAPAATTSAGPVMGVAAMTTWMHSQGPPPPHTLHQSFMSCPHPSLQQMAALPFPTTSANPPHNSGQQRPSPELKPVDIKALMEAFTGRKRQKNERKKVKMGSGKHLTFKELAEQFPYGLKDAAARLGICPTTLKRACRRNGIERWPCRQIAKLNKTMNEMGYKGSPPKTLLDSAMKGKLRTSNLSKDLCAPTATDDPSELGTQAEAISWQQSVKSNNTADPSTSEKGFSSAPASLGLLAGAEEDDSEAGPSSDLFAEMAAPQGGDQLEKTMRGADNMLHALHRVSSAPNMEMKSDFVDPTNMASFCLSSINEEQCMGNCLLEPFTMPENNETPGVFTDIGGVRLDDHDVLDMADFGDEMDEIIGHSSPKESVP
ncbi:hypothetical protein BSKO_01504 [Bryopsis sp. KO-2023]|nr:hypothetical protein BSKO_01504 [Bryopsis sp. KO-2023]